MDATASSWSHLDLDDDSWMKDSSSFGNARPSIVRSQDPNPIRWNHTPTVSEPYTTTSYHYNGFIHPNDFTSEQAAQALTALSHPPNKLFEDDSYPDCCQPCDQPCNSEDIFECFSVDAAPCYDERCTQRCEWDGADTLCNDSHTEEISDILCCLHAGCVYKTTSEAELLHHCTVAHACGGRTHWDCRTQTPFGPFPSTSNHVHNQYCRDEFINPLLLHPDGCSKKPSFSTDHFGCGDFHPHIILTHFGTAPSFEEEHHNSSRLCCPAPSHHPSFASHVTNSHQANIPGSCFMPHVHLSNPSLHGRRASLAPSGMACTSPTSTNPDFLDSMTECSSPSAQTYVCNWLGKETKLPCSFVFMTSLELQSHIEEFHLRLDEQIAASNKEDSLVCCWKGCSFAQTKKKWRQAQHLKDHLRTHTKRQLHSILYFNIQHLSNIMQTKLINAISVKNSFWRRNRLSNTAEFILEKSRSSAKIAVLASLTNLH